MISIPLADLNRQYQGLKPDIDAAVAGVIERGAFVQGPEVTEFAAVFARACGVAEGVGTSSGTAALYLALRALGIGPGDEVITTAHSFIATTEAICFSGARPVLIDIDERTYNIDPALIAAAVTPKTRTILAVHLYGQPADMAAIQDVAARHGLLVIEDAAQAHLATFAGQRVGSFGAAACFSFFPGKNCGAFGDAGMVVTDDQDLAEQIRMLADHGRREKYRHELMGFNFRLDTLQAAVLNVKLKALPRWNEQRRRIAARYDAAFQSVLQIPETDVRAGHVYHQYVIRVPDRDRMRAQLKEQGIATGVHYPVPLHLQPAHHELGYRMGDFPVAEKCCAEVLSLPVFPEMTDEEIDRVIAAVQACVQGP